MVKPCVVSNHKVTNLGLSLHSFQVSTSIYHGPHFTPLFITRSKQLLTCTIFIFLNVMLLFYCVICRCPSTFKISVKFDKFFFFNISMSDSVHLQESLWRRKKTKEQSNFLRFENTLFMDLNDQLTNNSQKIKISKISRTHSSVFMDIW